MVICSAMCFPLKLRSNISFEAFLDLVVFHTPERLIAIPLHTQSNSTTNFTFNHPYSITNCCLNTFWELKTVDKTMENLQSLPLLWIMGHLWVGIGFLVSDHLPPLVVLI